MTFFVGTTTPGDRWKIYLPTAALAQIERSLDSSAASALLRSRWSDAAADQRPQQVVKRIPPQFSTAQNRMISRKRDTRKVY